MSVAANHKVDARFGQAICNAQIIGRSRYEKAGPATDSFVI